MNFPPSTSVALYAPLLAKPDGQAEQNEPTAFDLVTGPAENVADLSQHMNEQSESKKKTKKRKKRRTNKPSKWADKCMYAELLEMISDDPWSSGVPPNDATTFHDGLPKDLETGWIAVAPVPRGKRCLAVTHQSAGIAGIGEYHSPSVSKDVLHILLVPNTTLRSRLLGKSLIHRFPSSLPPLTILDCILDENWRDNGILHVLDVVKWKGQDVGDCEAGFR